MMIRYELILYDSGSVKVPYNGRVYILKGRWSITFRKAKSWLPTGAMGTPKRA